jgi:hypothetical protein
MGIPRGSARLLIEEAKARPFSGSVLQLGRSSVYFGWRDLQRWAARAGFELRPLEPEPSHDPRLAAQGCIADATFFRALGFEDVRSCDLEPWEGADYLFDLNREAPAELHGRFDAVFETGTIVQVFDLPRVMANLHRLVRPGGRVIHCAVPSNNHMDLGFYMLCPTFFADYYQANGWRVETHYLCEYFAWWLDGRLYTGRWRVWDYRPGLLDALSYGRYGGPQAATFVVATKLAESSGGVIPQLGQYRAAWREFRSDRAAGAAAAVETAERASRAHPSTPERILLQSAGGRRVAAALKRLVEVARRRLLPRPLPRPKMRL